MTRREDDHPYREDQNLYVADARPGPWQKRVTALIVALCLAIVLIYCTGCYGTAIDTRSITADKVTISQNTPWSNLTITAEGWNSTVKGQPSYVPPGPHVEASAKARPGVGLKAPETGGAPPSAVEAAPGAVPALGSASPAADSPSK